MFLSRSVNLVALGLPFFFFFFSNFVCSLNSNFPFFSLFLVFQLHAAISHQVDPECLGLGLGGMLLNSLKQTVVTLASNAGVLNTVQSAAQAVLQSGWSVLLPTAEERARALSALLPSAGWFYDEKTLRCLRF